MISWGWLRNSSDNIGNSSGDEQANLLALKFLMESEGETAVLRLFPFVRSCHGLLFLDQAVNHQKDYGSYKGRYKAGGFTRFIPADQPA